MTLTPDQELAEIEWCAGLIPMPQHLVEMGTRVHRLTHKIIRNPDAPPMTAQWLSEGGPLPPLKMSEYMEVPLDRPIVRTYVWGELVDERLD